MNEEKREENIASSNEEPVRPNLNVKDLILSLAAVLLCGCVLSGAIPAAFIGLASAALFVYVVIAIRNIGAVIQILLASIIATVLTFLPICGAVVLALILIALIIGTAYMESLLNLINKNPDDSTSCCGGRYDVCKRCNIF